MMSPDKTDAGKDKQASAGRKTASTRPQEPALKCPRCGSPNTKFCYYNNYSLTQQRHFCKTCRRYWTKGGALRNVPIGGGCRKNKKMKSSISPIRVSENSNNSNGSSSNISGLKLFQGISPAMDFQIQPPSSGLFNQFSSFGDKITNPCLNQEMGLINFSFTTTSPLMGFQEIGSLTQGNHLASSIESLSSINQELHWKLQQQRLAMLFVGDNDNNQKDNTCVPSGSIEGFVQKPQPILFQNLDISKADQSYNKIETSRKDGNLSTEWFFDNTFGTANQTPATSGSNMNENSRGWNPIQAWSDLDQYNALP